MVLKITLAQECAINHFEGPALVVAGPGAGKTFVITERVKKLIIDKGINPKDILVTTFTEKAANELKIKLAESIKEKAELIQISTIHSFCKLMLEKYFSYHEYGSEINILDDDSQTLFLDFYGDKLGISYWENRHRVNLKPSWDYIGDIKKLYNQFTQNFVDIPELLKYMSKNDLLNENDEKVIYSYIIYRHLLKTEKRVDFSMLETMFYSLINNNNEVLEEIQEQFKFILVDEYQDTSPIQDQIFRKISGKYNNLFVVGDENQSIYAFRGASIINFLNFLKVYNNAKKYFLDVNFRSTETIVNCSNKVFKYEVKKILNSKRRKGEHFRLIYEEDSDSAAEETVKLIKKLKTDHIINKYSDVALLFRSLKSHSPEFIKYLSKENIPFVTFGDGKFFERDEIRTVIYLMSYVTQELYIDNYFKKWSNWWRKDIFLSDFFDFEKHTKEIIKDADFNLFDLRFDDNFKEKGFVSKQDINVLKRINKLKYDVQKEKDSFGELDSGKNSLLKIFYKLLDYSGYFKKLIESKTIEKKEKLQNLGRLSEIIAKYQDISKKEDVKGFLRYIYRIYDKLDQKKIESEDTVKLMTVHQSKGLEFPVVILCCLNESRFPLGFKEKDLIHIPSKFLNKDELKNEKDLFFEEERRLFYVGLTRAQDLLIFTSSQKHRVRNWKKSRFLDVIQSEISDEEFKLPLEKKYKIPKKIPSLNYSAINAFIDCPLRYTLTYDFNFVTPVSFMQNIGVFVHNVLQRIHERMSKNIEITPSEMKEIVDFYWVDLPIKKKNNDIYKKKLIVSFVNYYITAKNDYKEIIAIEKSFSYIDDNMIIKGKVDLIVKDKDGNVVLIDFKARKKKGIEKTNVGKQLQIYNYCLGKEYDINKMFAFTFQDLSKTEFPVNKEKVVNFLKEISLKISKENFYKQKNYFCKDCQFNFYCWGNKI